MERLIKGFVMFWVLSMPLQMSLVLIIVLVGQFIEESHAPTPTPTPSFSYESPYGSDCLTTSEALSGTRISCKWDDYVNEGSGQLKVKEETK